jgi:hypothetical protein
MNRPVFAPAIGFLAVVLSSSLAFAQAGQAAKAAPTTPSKPVPTGGWAKPHKGTATIEVIRGNAKRVGNEMVTVLNVRNTTDGAIALLKVDEYWYDKSNTVVSGDAQKVTRLIGPGEIVEITCKSPWNANMLQNQYMFSHVNGDIKAKLVKQFK